MRTALLAATAVLLCASTGQASAACAGIPTANSVKAALISAVGQNNGGLGNDMWATIVDRVGTVCLVVRSTNNLNAIWLGSRVISAQKANTGNAFSLPNNAGGTDIALSSANLYSAVQPGGSLFGLQESNPVNADVAYDGNTSAFGDGSNDPLVGQLIGGINVFGGGLALYNSAGVRVGGLGVSGDTSCTDHFVAWRVRHSLNLDNVPGGVNAGDDNIIYDIDASGHSASGFGHPRCLNDTPAPSTLPETGPSP
jgi:uncharacterized protein GlcG (DUF336 family)